MGLEDKLNAESGELGIGGLADEPLAEMDVTREGPDQPVVVRSRGRSDKGVLRVDGAAITPIVTSRCGRDRMYDLRAGDPFKALRSGFSSAVTAVSDAEVPKLATHRIVSGETAGQYVRIVSATVQHMGERNVPVAVGYICGGKRDGLKVFPKVSDIVGLDGLPMTEEALATLMPAKVIVSEKDDEADEKAEAERNAARIAREVAQNAAKIAEAAKAAWARDSKKKRTELGVPSKATHKVLGDGIYAGHYARFEKAQGVKSHITIFLPRDKKLGALVANNMLEKLDF